MIKVSVLYPNGANSNFDMNYYLTKHIPMVKQKLGTACKNVAVEEGIAGGAPGAPGIARLVRVNSTAVGLISSS